jgi:hypothetical protein
MRITIRVPKKDGDRWKVGNYLRRNPNTMLKATEKLLRKATLKSKTSVYVKYSNGQHNESYPSLDVTKQVYAAVCFLEDYLSDKMIKKYEKSL